MESVISNEVNYKPAAAARDIYRYTRLTPDINSGNFALDATSNPAIAFEIPTKVINLSESYLNFRMDIVAAALQWTTINAKGAAMINRVSLETRSGIVLCDIPYCDVYTKTVLPVVTESCQRKFNSFGAYGGANVDPILPCLPLSNSSTDALVGAAYGSEYAGMLSGDSTEFIYDLANTEGAYRAELPYTLANRFIVPAAATHVNIAYRIPLATFAHTLLSVDKSMIFPEVVILRVTFNNYTTFLRGSDNTGAVDAAKTVTSVNITNAQMMLAVSKDADVSDRLIAQLHSKGIKMTIPYVHSSLNTLDSAEQSVNLRYNIGFGKRLLCIYNVVLPGVATRYLSSNNINAALVTKYYSAIDSIRLQESDLNSSRQEDYMYHKELLEGSCVQGSAAYAYNRVEIDSFRAGKTVDWLMNDTVDDGLQLGSNEITYTIFHTIPSGAFTSQRHTYTFAVTQKELNLSSQGISLY